MKRLQRILINFVVILILFSCFTSLNGKTYLKSGEIDFKKLMIPPPDQEQTKKEIEEMLKIQAKRNLNDIDYAIADCELSIFRFSTVLGDKFNIEDLPETAMFFREIIKNTIKIGDPLKEIWDRPRPNDFDNRIKPCLWVPENPSYPSGHSTVGNLIAIILADMLPEKKLEIIKRGKEFAMNRVIGGVHYPSDIEAGKIIADLIADKIFKNNEFKKDYKKIRSEIRSKLGYDK